MSRLWWALVAGLVLGAVFFGMMQRGCSAQAGSPGAADGGETPAAPTSRVQTRAAATPESAVEIRSGLGPSARERAQAQVRSMDIPANRPVRTESAMVESRREIIQRALGNAPQSQTLDRDRLSRITGGRSPTVLEDARRRARQEAEARRTEAMRRVEQARRAAATSDDAADPARAATVSASGRLTGGASEGPRSRILELQARAAEAEEGGGGGRARLSDIGLSSDSSSEGSGSDGSGEPRGTVAGLNASTGLSGGGDGGGVGGGGGPGGGGSTPPTTGGGGGSGGGGAPPANGGGGGGGGDGPPDTPTDGGSSPDDGGAPPQSPSSVVAEWRAADLSAACDPPDTRTNDLFLVSNRPLGVLTVGSTPPVGLRIEGGSFVQLSAGGGNTPPSPTALAGNPCLARDSFLTIEGAPGLLLAVAPNPDNWGPSLLATWAATGAPTGVTGAQDAARFGDDLFRLRIGRMTARGNPTFVGGSVQVTLFDPQAGSVQTLTVEVPHCGDCWEAEEPSDAGPSLEALTLSPTRISAGGAVVGSVRLTGPAPAGGTTVSLSADLPDALTLPPTVTVPEGEVLAAFDIVTGAVETVTEAQISATLAGVTRTATLTIDPPAPFEFESFTISPESVISGDQALGRVRISAPAPPGGVLVLLASGDPAVRIRNTSVQIQPGETEATFPVLTTPIQQSVTALLWAAIGSDVRTVSLQVLESVPGDLSRDGRVDGADLGQLLQAWGPCEGGAPTCQGDLNGDGTVDGADLGLLLQRFNQRADDAPPSPLDRDVVARWVPVDAAGCADLEGFRTNDLYLGFRDPDGLLVMEAVPPDTLRIEGGGFYQHPFGSDQPPPDNAGSFDPCIVFDSHLAIGESDNLLIIPGATHSASDWGPFLNVTWAALGTTVGVAPQQDPQRFGDDRFYIRVGRFTAPKGVRRVGGAVEAVVVDAVTGGSGSTLVEVPHCPLCWASLDFDGDGVVDGDDVALMVARMGTTDESTDLDQDGFVTGEDLRLMLEGVAEEAASSQTP